MLIPRPVRAPVLVWVAAVAAGVAESLVRLAMPDPPGADDLAVRGAIYLVVVVVILALRTGSDTVRWVLALGLGVGGTASLLVEPIGWLADGGSPTTFLATVDVAMAGVVVLRVAHVGAVGVAVVLMFRAGTSEFFHGAHDSFPLSPSHSATAGLPQDLPRPAESRRSRFRRPSFLATKGTTMTAPIPFEVYEPGVLLHGTRADLAAGDLLVAGHTSNYEEGRVMNHVYVTETLDVAAWGAELARGERPGRIYVVEATGVLEDDPNVTDKVFPGNPTRSYRSREPVRIVRELRGWTGHSPEEQRARKEYLADLRRRGAAVMFD